MCVCVCEASEGLNLGRLEVTTVQTCAAVSGEAADTAQILLHCPLHGNIRLLQKDRVQRGEQHTQTHTRAEMYTECILTQISWRSDCVIRSIPACVLNPIPELDLVNTRSAGKVQWGLRDCSPCPHVSLRAFRAVSAKFCETRTH